MLWLRFGNVRTPARPPVRLIRLEKDGTSLAAAAVALLTAAACSTSPANITANGKVTVGYTASV
jgi:hypothetical protein